MKTNMKLWKIFNIIFKNKMSAVPIIDVYSSYKPIYIPPPPPSRKGKKTHDPSLDRLVKNNVDSIEKNDKNDNQKYSLQRKNCTVYFDFNCK